ncbi:unnamed protein product [Cuscuta campestris]|uniref:Uncharacterized protein n=1 Tax=Cuscuta campestris TaxID=132261 RepID=A0A484KVE0_9ASTE|nr:unnamed protein product [Cuscuta campestris]
MMSQFPGITKNPRNVNPSCASVHTVQPPFLRRLSSAFTHHLTSVFTSTHVGALLGKVALPCSVFAAAGLSLLVAQHDHRNLQESQVDS